MGPIQFFEAKIRECEYRHRRPWEARFWKVCGILFAVGVIVAVCAALNFLGIH
jgi:hypothetical protein